MDYPIEQMKTIEKEYGFWKSPITAERAAEGAKKIVTLIADGDSLYWNEVRPENKGRYTIVKDGVEDVTPPDFNARAAVHEYGGGAFTVKDGVLIATNFSDHKVHIKKPGKEWEVLIDGKGTRFADFRITDEGVLAVGESHREGEEPENFIALIKDGTFKKLTSGSDFYAYPEVSTDGKKIAYIAWNHPEMPWTNTELWLLEGGETKKIAGDGEAIFQPQWSPDGTLHFVSDRDEWWNLYCYVNGKVEKVFSIEAEMGRPLWQLNRSTYAFKGDAILFTYFKEGFYHLALYQNGKIQEWNRSGVSYGQIRSGPNYFAFLESFSNKPSQVVKLGVEETVVSSEKEEKVDPGYVSEPEHVAFKSANRTAYGYYYPPKNKEYQGKKGTRPPLVVMIHGGPTSQARPELSLATQFWTSRGFAVLDINYGGSTGYGRAYRMLLNGNWGIVDVEDCVNGARYVVDKGLADQDKLFIRGGSAGGYTTLAALAFHDTFKGGGSYYGVADLKALADDTHKFESHYLDSLLGDDLKIWEERSPIRHTDQFQEPLIIFQGSEDKIVPPAQSEMIYQALKKKGVKTEMVLYEGEQHGFRKKENIIDSLNKELAFYQNLL